MRWRSQASAVAPQLATFSNVVTIPLSKYSRENPSKLRITSGGFFKLKFSLNTQKKGYSYSDLWHCLVQTESCHLEKWGSVLLSSGPCTDGEIGSNPHGASNFGWVGAGGGGGGKNSPDGNWALIPWNRLILMVIWFFSTCLDCFVNRLRDIFCSFCSSTLNLIKRKIRD